MSTAFEFTQAEIRKPSPPITSILDFINGDGSDGVAPVEKTTREENFQSLLPLTSHVGSENETPPWLSADEALEIDIDSLRSKTENELIAHWLSLHGYGDKPDQSQATEEIFSQAMDWARSFVGNVIGERENPIEKYRPSNGTEGEIFQDAFCHRCEKDSEASPCRILLTTMAVDVDDPEYPSEWQYDADEKAVCTAFCCKKECQIEIKAPAMFDFVMSDSIDVNTEPTEEPEVVPVAEIPVAHADYSKLYHDAIEKWKEDCFRAESDYKTRLEKLKKDQTDAAIAIEKAGEVVKQTKKVHKAIMLRLMNALDSGATFPDRPSMPDIVKLAKESEPDELVEVTTEIAADGTTTVKKKPIVNNDTTWRAVPTEKVLEAVEGGLGPKKREAVIDEFPTLGHLIDTLHEARKTYQNFSKLLPDGIGVELADRIENAALDAIGKHSSELQSI